MNFAEARRHMVNSQVRTNDVADLRLQAAIERAPRELFLPPSVRNQAYFERELETGEGRRLLRIRDFAKLLAAAEVLSGDLALDVACGSGYTTAVIAALADTVVATETSEAAASAAQENLSAAGVANAAVVTAEPAAGAPRQGPFDVIVIGSGAIEIEPKALLDQLAEGGRFAAILREDRVSRGVVWTKTGGAVAPRIVFDAATSFVLPEFAAPRRFRF